MTSEHDRFTPLEATVLDEVQSGFPLQPRPYRALGNQYEDSESAVFNAVCRLTRKGFLRRVGPVLNPPVIGSSALVAMRVPPSKFDTIARTVNAYPEVNHNYRRNHDWNMWFVVTADSRRNRMRLLADIEAETGLDVLALPMRTQYYINLEFPVLTAGNLANCRDPQSTIEPVEIHDFSLDLDRFQRRLLLEVQDGFEIDERPYQQLATALDTDLTSVLTALRELRDRNVIKRIGCVVNHHAVGFDENCMVVWDVPSEERDKVGRLAGAHPAVTYCCHRVPRDEHDWPYTLFTMIHGRCSEAVEETIDDLADGPLPYPHMRLHTEAALKQTGARYRELFNVWTTQEVETE